MPRALAYLALVGLAVLFLWLTLRVDLVIFGGVLFAISLRRAAEALSRWTRLPVGWSLLAVVLLIIAFFFRYWMVFLAGDCRSDRSAVPTAAGGSWKSRKYDQPVGHW